MAEIYPTKPPCCHRVGSSDKNTPDAHFYKENLRVCAYVRTTTSEDNNDHNENLDHHHGDPFTFHNMSHIDRLVLTIFTGLSIGIGSFDTFAMKKI